MINDKRCYYTILTRTQMKKHENNYSQTYPDSHSHTHRDTAQV